MQDIEKELFCFDILNQLHDEFGVIDPDGKLARQIQEATGKELGNILRYLQGALLQVMEAKAIQESNKAMVGALRIAKNSVYGV